MFARAISRVSLTMAVQRAAKRALPREATVDVAQHISPSFPSLAPFNQRAGALRGFAAAKIDGKAIAELVRKDVAKEVDVFTRRIGRKPGLAVVLVGERPDSAKYVEMKKKAAAECGFESVERVLPDTVAEEELIGVVQELNANPGVDGILVQLPLPDHIDQKLVLRSIDVLKDVDGFHPYNIGELARRGEELRQAREEFSVNDVGNAPCTPLGCIELLDRTGVDLDGKHVVVIGRSNIVGLPVAIMAIHRNATVTMCHSHTADLPAVSRTADVLIAAIGQPEFVKGDWIKPGAVVIDVGVNFKDDPTRKSGRRMCGDVDYAAAAEVASAITPVPGGVGPMTVAMLMHNTITQASHRAARTIGYRH
mmetsp:Transcript_88702/g.215007  ORF Transcript_88702/g.215007 Transcript_88702/m.215007 type:complete len:366 (-) Transcript_88702:6-1103(-)